MLSALHVRGLALVEDVWLELSGGFTVLTGETGAGKTVLVEALKLLLGERADSTMVRQGADEALVEGTFLIDGREVLVKRRLSAEGRSRCTIDGEMATVGVLADLLGSHVDLHGQHEHQALLSPARHAGYLDRFIGTPALSALERYRTAWTAARDARAALDELERALSDREQRADYLRFQIADIDDVGPAAGEDDDLTARLPRLRHAERLTAAAGAAWSVLRDEGGASDSLSASISALAGAPGLDPQLDEFASTIERLDVELQEVATSLRAYADAIEHDPAVLDETERRLRQLGDLKRKYGPSLIDVIETRAGAVRDLELLDAGDAGRARALEGVDAAERALVEAGEALSAVRAEAVASFVTRLQEAASELALPHATFAVAQTLLPRDAWTADGPERLEFLFAASAGEEPRPLAKVASGGEVSRVMLALKSVLGSADAVPVLVFDEVDVGIGGASALAVGRQLASVGGQHQVLVITHLPQVAAYSDCHIVVSKEASGGRSVTTARPVEGEERVAELARMLSGGRAETGAAHARELLLGAAADRGTTG